ncbi:MAG: aspartyl/glutamyl-tRNA amidotransferase subunit C [Anaerolineae bacterium]|uniref:Asp-tRNA(Asn)/Glu-tRNA(Gln) amidotransferase subunit GatC n=1 Tax=Promineifilum sp. TaxID=2664178 RepID=UPI001DF74124|nr:aspartyl/glutamyl-tRNA amidotransferase subunit C [Anaerolineales bacterium]MCB8936624.1 aspartyl/glutamyl-tRNA amidotransferase subunit C [Promineifilum sp.]MCO5178792.1 aspartyl/glutamyl-tRNA amidotransferase subunit C [Promineifilum sp.]MCW5846862.1 aspartyl/glutamyl-tRNA amidotransferase subunit C [Anaerolineae bacterium]
MSLSRADVLKIANLARLALTDSELEHYGAQLSAVLDYAARLNELDLSGLDTKQDGQLGGDTRYNVMRDDVITPSLAPEDSMFNAAATAGHQFLIQSVLDE